MEPEKDSQAQPPQQEQPAQEPNQQPAPAEEKKEAMVEEKKEEYKHELYDAKVAPPLAERLPRARAAYGGRTRIAAFFESTYDDWYGKVVTVGGWAKTLRVQQKGAFVFIELSDGSTFRSLQVVAHNVFDGFEEVLKTGVGASFLCKGTLVKSPAKGQPIELLCDNKELHSVKLIGTCDQGTYPLSKKKHSQEFLRDIAHLRPRTNLIGAVARVRNSLAFATHKFFNERGFLYVHTPIITASDCEGAGEMFQVTTTLPAPSKPITDVKLVEGESKAVNYKEDFFSKPAFLTVSGQLNVENFSCSLSDVYTFGPTFRAENSHTTRHLAEFWMIEPELAFAGMEEN